MNATIVLIIVIVLGILGTGIGIYIYMKDKTLEQIRLQVYDLFLVAERTFLTSKSGKQKMKFVVNKARCMLPTWLQFFITDAMLEKLIQEWFNAVKDLLDDGKYNNSTKKQEVQKMNQVQQILKKADSFLGVKESPAGSNKVLFNTKYYGKVVSGPKYPWCMVFIWYLFYICALS